MTAASVAKDFPRQDKVLGHRLGIFILILGGVKGIVEATHAPFARQFVTVLSKTDRVLSVFVILSAQE
jgi:hypothetical protein